MGRFTNAVNEGLGKGLLRRYAFMGFARTGLLSKDFIYSWGLVERPHYAFGLLRAAEEAKALGHSGMTAVEFGVAGGNGLLQMEKYAQDLSAKFEIDIRVVGFDTGAGLPPPQDYRDLPHLWASGDFQMDVDALTSRLTSAQLVLGPINETLPGFIEQLNARTPIGFVAVDVDLWSSTRDCLALLESDASKLLPRIWCYFDDIISTIPDVGELLAIDQFNEANDHIKIRRPFSLRSNVPLQPTWAEQMWQAHSFRHPDYCRLLANESQRQLPLTGD